MTLTDKLATHYHNQMAEVVSENKQWTRNAINGRPVTHQRRNHNAAIVALVILAVGMVGFLSGLFYGGTVTLNTVGDSKGVSVCAGPVQGGVYVNTATGHIGSFTGCDF